MFDNLDLNAIQDENARELIRRLLNLIEELSADLRDAQAENQRLRDEVNRLKGEQGKPKIKGNRPKPPPSNHSSENERRKPRKRHKRSKKAEIQIDREQVVEVDPSVLPKDARFKGYCCGQTIFYSTSRNTMLLRPEKPIWQNCHAATMVSLVQGSRP